MIKTEYCTICEKELNDEFVSKCLKCKVVLCDSCAIKHNFLCTDCITPVKKIEIPSIRRSYIELYKTCPRAFKLIAIDGLEVPNGVYAKIGIFLHDLFDNASKKDKMYMEGEAIYLTDWTQLKLQMHSDYVKFFTDLKNEEFEGCQRKLSIEDFRRQQLQKGIDNIEGYFEMCISMTPAWKTEEQLFVDIPNTKIKASITFDRVNKNADGTYDLVDYKSGKVYVGKDFTEELQPALYIHAVQTNYNIQVQRFILLFTGESKERIYNRIDDDRFMCLVGKKEYVISISEKLNEISEVFQKIEKGQFDIPLDLHDWYCQNQCSCFKVHACEGKFNSKWKKV